MAAWQAAIGCTVPTAFGTVSLDIAGTLALATALGVDVAAVAALLPDIRAGMMSGAAKVHQDTDRHG